MWCGDTPHPLNLLLNVNLLCSSICKGHDVETFERNITLFAKDIVVSLYLLVGKCDVADVRCRAFCHADLIDEECV